MSKGKVKQYNVNQGYGSIIDSDSGQLLTVYANYIHLPEGVALKEGMEVEYEIQQQRNENWAVNVRAREGQ